MEQVFLPLRKDTVPDLQMIADDLEERQWSVTLFCPDSPPAFRSFQLYTGQRPVRPDVLYVLGADAEDFPADECAYASVTDVNGAAPHISVSGRSEVELCNELMLVFRRYWGYVSALNDIVSSGGDLEELCRISCDFFKNPVYLHDSSFTVLALPRRLPGMLPLDYNPRTGRYYVPLWLVEEFKSDEVYRESLKTHGAQLWQTDRSPRNYRTLFVNLWDGENYRGRLLINELQSTIEKGKFRMAERLAEAVIRLLRRDEGSRGRNYTTFENMFSALLRGQSVDQTDMSMLLSILGWRETDWYVCLAVVNQSEGDSISDVSAARNELVSRLKSAFSFFMDNRLYIIANLTAGDLKMPELGPLLGPVFRDSLLYGGVSFPVTGVGMLGKAFRQAQYALRRVLRLRQSQWLMFFEDCVLSYALENIVGEFSTQMLASPALQGLLRHDREKGTEYYATLREYLRHERSIPRTSAALIIHRTTLEYRLEKIRQIMPLDLDDERVRLYLLMSFYLLDGE